MSKLDQTTLAILREQAKARRELYKTEYENEVEQARDLFIKQQTEWAEAKVRKNREDWENRVNIIKDWTPQQLEWLVWESYYATYSYAREYWHSDFYDNREFHRLDAIVRGVLNESEYMFYASELRSDYDYD